VMLGPPYAVGTILTRITYDWLAAPADSRTAAGPVRGAEQHQLPGRTKTALGAHWQLISGERAVWLHMMLRLASSLPCCSLECLTPGLTPLHRCCMGARGFCPRRCMCSQCRKWHSHMQQCSRCKHACSSLTSRAKWTRCAVAFAFDIILREHAAQQPYIHRTIRAAISAYPSVVWQVLGRRHADGSSIFTVDRLVEGIVAFEDEAMAEAFGHALETEGHQVLCHALSGRAKYTLVAALRAVMTCRFAVAQFATP
jgi:hypothetical protein